MLHRVGNLLPFFLLVAIVIADPRRALDATRGYWSIALGVGLLSRLSCILVLAALTLANNEGAASIVPGDRSPFGGRGTGIMLT